MDSINNINTITLQTGTKHSYIKIGKDIISRLSSIVSFTKWDTIVAIVGKRVYSLHSHTIDSFLSTINGIVLEYQDSELNKSYAYAESYFNNLLYYQCTRNSLLIGIGGGVTTDFAGYVASSYMRGIDVMYIPTTLLCMVDASIGGKVAVNIKGGKNIVGHFHQPECVVIDIDFLKTLPESEWRCGLSEIVKHAIIGDNQALELLRNGEIVIGDINLALYKCIESSVRFKASVVEKDENEKSIRAILNFGHTVGHAIESFFEYTLSHGEAVAAGMLIESYISFKNGMPKDDFSTIKEILTRYNLIPSISFDPQKVIQHMMYDKKNIRGNIRFVLLESIGKPLVGQVVKESLLLEALNYYLSLVH